MFTAVHDPRISIGPQEERGTEIGADDDAPNAPTEASDQDEVPKALSEAMGPRSEVAGLHIEAPEASGMASEAQIAAEARPAVPCDRQETSGSPAANPDAAFPEATATSRPCAKDLRVGTQNTDKAARSWCVVGRAMGLRLQVVKASGRPPGRVLADAHLWGFLFANRRQVKPPSVGPNQSPMAVDSSPIAID